MLRMIRYGLLAGFGFLLAVALLEYVATRPGRAIDTARGGLDTDVSEQVWAVLAEARKIVEESA